MLDSSPVEFATVQGSIKNGELMSSADAQRRMQGLGMETADVIFRQILNWNYTITYHHPNYTGFSEVVYKTRKGICDMSLHTFFITARRDLCTSACKDLPANFVATTDGDYDPYTCCVDYSYPYYSGGWALMSKLNSGGNIDYINVFFQQDIVHAICVGVICTFFMSHLIWLLERTQYGRSILHTNPREAFAPKYLDGLKDGMWFSANVLMNGVINSDKTLITPIGRLVSTVWVLFGILITCFITSVISATLTTNQLISNQIMTAEDMAGKRLCTTTGFRNSYWDSHFGGVGVQKTVVNFIDDCFNMLAQGKTDAVFEIREEALGYFQQGHGAGLMISPVFSPQSYGFVWAERWRYASFVTEALLMYEQAYVTVTPPYADSVSKWYPGSPNEITYGGKSATPDKEWKWGLIGTAIALVGAYMLLQTFVLVVSKFVAPPLMADEEAGGSRSHSMGRTKSVLVKAAQALSNQPSHAHELPVVSVDGPVVTSFTGGSMTHVPMVGGLGSPTATLMGSHASLVARHSMNAIVPSPSALGAAMASNGGGGARHSTSHGHLTFNGDGGSGGEHLVSALKAAGSCKGSMKSGLTGSLAHGSSMGVGAMSEEMAAMKAQLNYMAKLLAQSHPDAFAIPTVPSAADAAHAHATVGSPTGNGIGKGRVGGGSAANSGDGEGSGKLHLPGPPAAAVAAAAGSASAPTTVTQLQLVPQPPPSTPPSGGRGPASPGHATHVVVGSGANSTWAGPGHTSGTNISGSGSHAIANGVSGSGALESLEAELRPASPFRQPPR